MISQRGLRHESGSSFHCIGSSTAERYTAARVILAWGPPGSDASNALRVVHTVQQGQQAETGLQLVLPDFRQG